MGTSANVLSVQALEDLKTALTRFASEGNEALRAAAQEIQRTLDWLAERGRFWQSEVRRRQELLARAQRALAVCQQPVRDSEGRVYIPPCTREKEIVVQAQRYLAESESELHTVQKWLGDVQQAAAAYQRHAQRLGALLNQDLQRADALLGRKTEILQGYLQMSAPTTGSSARMISRPADAAATAPAASTSDTGGAPADGLWQLGAALTLAGTLGTVVYPQQDHQSGDTSTRIEAHSSVGADPSMVRGIQDVPLSQIEMSDTYVYSRDDFHKVSQEEMMEGMHKLEQTVRPAVQQGACGDYFSALDEQQGLSYEHGFRRTYDAFYADDAIRLDKVGDMYTVTGGYHRLYVAKLLGLTTIPAHISDAK